MSSETDQTLGVGPALAALQQNLSDFVLHSESGSEYQRIYQWCADALTPLIARVTQLEEEVSGLATTVQHYCGPDFGGTPDADKRTSFVLFGIHHLASGRDGFRAALAASEAARQQAEQERENFIDRCDEIRNGSPNAFYAHVDAFCKASRPPRAAPRKDE